MAISTLHQYVAEGLTNRNSVPQEPRRIEKPSTLDLPNTFDETTNVSNAAKALCQLGSKTLEKNAKKRQCTSPPHEATSTPTRPRRERTTSQPKRTISPVAEGNVNKRQRRSGPEEMVTFPSMRTRTTNPEKSFPHKSLSPGLHSSTKEASTVGDLIGTDPLDWTPQNVFYLLTHYRDLDTIFIPLNSLPALPSAALLSATLTKHPIDGYKFLLCTNDLALHYYGIKDPGGRLALGILIAGMRQRSPKYRRYCYENGQPLNLEPASLIDTTSLYEGKRLQERIGTCVTAVKKALLSRKGKRLELEQYWFFPIGCIYVDEKDGILNFSYMVGLDREKEGGCGGKRVNGLNAQDS